MPRCQLLLLPAPSTGTIVPTTGTGHRHHQTEPRSNYERLSLRQADCQTWGAALMLCNCCWSSLVRRVAVFARSNVNSLGCDLTQYWCCRVTPICVHTSEMVSLSLAEDSSSHMIGRAGGNMRKTYEAVSLLRMQVSWICRTPTQHRPLHFLLASQMSHIVAHENTSGHSLSYKICAHFCVFLCKGFFFEGREEGGADFGGNMKTYMEQEFETSVWDLGKDIFFLEWANCKMKLSRRCSVGNLSSSWGLDLNRVINW